MYVLGNGSPTSLPTGCFTFPFAFVLPQSIPSSFEGKNKRFFLNVEKLHWNALSSFYFQLNSNQSQICECKSNLNHYLHAVIIKQSKQV
jgi:hypothetical protein